jgi:hypothetical protein
MAAMSASDSFAAPDLHATHAAPAVTAIANMIMRERGLMDAPSLGLARAAEFLADHTADCALEGLLRTPNVLAQRVVDQTLIVAASGAVHLLKEPFENIFVNPNRDSLLSFWY